MSSPALPTPPPASVGSVCLCEHLSDFLARHTTRSQTHTGQQQQQQQQQQSASLGGSLVSSLPSSSAALTSVVHWLGPAASTNLLTAIPTHTQPTTELQALLQTAITFREEQKASAGRSRRPPSSAGVAPVDRLTRLAPLQPHCSAITCGQVTRTLLACLDCTNVGCWTPRGLAGNTPAHSRQHAQDYQHALALDFSRLSVYCFACNNFVYHPAVEQLIQTIQHDVLTRKRRRDQLESTSTLHWSPSVSKVFSERVKWIGADPLAGLRGMYNLGNTCFMSVVLQSLLHNPLLRNYFLSDLHNPHRCPRRLKVSHGAAPSAATVCLACDLDELFSQFYSGDHAPDLPNHFLYSMWTYADHLAGYAQQDAHELLMAVVDGVHSTCAEYADSIQSRTSAEPCRCVIHTVFGGTLRSDVSCDTCHTNSTAIDAILDISLDLAHQPAHPHQTTQAASASAPLTLVDCLNRFTQVERLYHTDKFFCSRCQSHENSTKQMSVHVLPLVLCLHLKRFDHHGVATGRSGAKVEQVVSFPLVGLDLGPYRHEAMDSPLSPKATQAAMTQSASWTQANGADNTGAPAKDAATTSAGVPRVSTPADPSSSSCLYDLFCVIVHKGSIDTGHYLCYVRRSVDWFRIDDRHVVQVEKEEVAHASAYILFYAKTQL